MQKKQRLTVDDIAKEMSFDVGTDKHIESTFIGTFEPRWYLNEYYCVVDHENDELLKFYAAIYKDVSPQSVLLEFGGGPAMYSLISAANRVKAIYFCDFLEVNLQEIRLWQKGEDTAFNWDPFIQRVLEIEGIHHVTQKDTQQRSQLIRAKLIQTLRCNASDSHPLENNTVPLFDIVQTNFVAESITSSLTMWEQTVGNIVTLLKPQGTFIMTALKNAKYYHIGAKRFPAVNIDEKHMYETLPRLGFPPDKITIQTVQANAPYRGYDGFLFATAQKQGNRI